MRITKRTNIAVRLLMYCAANSDRLVTKSEIADRCKISENHLAQVINQLSQLGFLNTHRGRRGGIALARPASEIRVGDVFRQVEGPVPIVECFGDGDDTCPQLNVCRLRTALSDAAQAFFHALDEVTLDALVCDPVDMMDAMRPAACVRA
ncbi:Rrf2 family transcriptional regulator [Epibacterium sp. SM1979]|uniref:Rrf2 family transcriptional regulator n=1 Tax=Tritonibacter litoralis TaxID=2662264 RepID=A0A843YJ75_9RHOB|nr:Rrf2 family transcriptional regulator [Tritonibacter litoralis]MQQ09715.1 Rrf2 family transcriptional regulator [Tritonibacter litoralis]